MQRTVQTEHHARLQALMERYLGPSVMRAFGRDDVTEIYVNPQDGRLRLDVRGEGKVTEPARLEEARIEQFLNAVATLARQALSESHPVIQAELPAGTFGQARLQGFLPPLTSGACFVVRKRADRLYRLEDYVAAGILSSPQEAAIRNAIDARHNILVCGPTKSGKTTLCNAILLATAEAFPDDRLVILEDTLELQCAAEDYLQLQSSETYGLADLVKYTLRCAPDRIIVGEVRDEAALYMLDAWATGHPGGCTTVHASSTLGALRRLDRLAQRAGVPPQRELIAEAIDLVVRMEGDNATRRITDMSRVAGLTPDGRYDLQPAALSS